MSDRTVAEVMGWEVHNPHRCPSTPPPGDYLAWKCAECGEWVNENRPGETQCSSPWNQHPKPTPDDMLSWLREQGYGIEIGTAHNATEVGVEISRWDDWHEYTVTEDHYAPTLHAALGAAVLAVSAAQDVEQQGDDGEDDQNGGQHG